jgi:hypothetical protein
MNFLLGMNSIEKSTLLFQIGYNYIEYDIGSKNDFIFYISSSLSYEIKNQLLGKYNIVDQDIIEKIHIKIINNEKELISFLFTLFNFPKNIVPNLIIFDDILSLLDNIQNNSNQEEKEENFYNKIMNIFTICKTLNELMNIKILIGINMILNNNDIENENNENIIILNCILMHYYHIYNLIILNENVNCFKLKINFDLNKNTYFNIINQKIKEKELIKNSIEITDNEYFGKIIEATICKFEILIKNYFKEDNNDEEEDKNKMMNKLSNKTKTKSKKINK